MNVCGSSTSFTPKDGVMVILALGSTGALPKAMTIEPRLALRRVDEVEQNNTEEISQWNTIWTARVRRVKDGWTAEAAIPWSELAAHSPQAGDVWACHLERRVPGVGAQAWPEALLREPTPAQFGLLRFEAGP